VFENVDERCTKEHGQSLRKKKERTKRLELPRTIQTDRQHCEIAQKGDGPHFDNSGMTDPRLMLARLVTGPWQLARKLQSGPHLNGFDKSVRGTRAC
jgi:hypothetical protein